MLKKSTSPGSSCITPWGTATLERLFTIAREMALRNLKNPADADDVALTCVCRVWQHVGRRIQNYEAFVCRTARCESRQLRRRTIERREVRLGRAFTPAEREAGAMSPLASTIRSYLDALPLEHQALIHMRWIHAMPCSEIAQCLGRTQGAVRVALCRLKRNLRRRLGMIVSATVLPASRVTRR